MFKQTCRERDRAGRVGAGWDGEGRAVMRLRAMALGKCCTVYCIDALLRLRERKGVRDSEGKGGGGDLT